MTASRSERPGEEIPGHVTVVTAEEIRHLPARNLDDLLRQVAGFGLFRRSSSLVAHPTTQGASMRGIGASGAGRALVLVDGIPAQDPFGGWVYWSGIPPEMIERIEIVHGGGSSLWGSGALGGVVNIITRSTADARPELAVAGGEMRELSLFGLYGGSLAGADWKVAGRSFQTAGYEVVHPDQRGLIDDAAWSESGTIRWGLSTAAGSSGRLELDGGYFVEERGNGTPLTGNGTRTADFSLKWSLHRRDAASWAITLYGKDQVFDSSFSSQAPDRSGETPALDQFRVDGEVVGAGIQWTGEISPRQSATAGADLRRVEGRTNERFIWNGSGFDRLRRAGGRQIHAGLFSGYMARPAERIRFDASLRADVWRHENGFRLEREIGSGAVLIDDEFERRSESSLNPRLALRYELPGGASVWGAAYTSFRAPTINELYRPFRVRNDATEANADLAPEELEGVDLGFRLGSDRITLQTTVFNNWIHDPVANVTLAVAGTSGTLPPCGFIPAGGSCSRRLNLERVQVTGAEVELRVALAPGWSADLSFIQTRNEITSAPVDPALEGKSPVQTPERIVTGGITCSPAGHFGARVQWRHVGEQFEDGLNTIRLAPYALADLSAWVRAGGSLELNFSIENLFDRRFETGLSSSGLITTGMPLRAMAGVRWTLH